MRKVSGNLASLLERFFVHHLINQKRVSSETVSAYRDTFRLLLKYAERELGKAPSQLDLDNLDAPFICAFLNHLEQERRNRPQSRNYRLAAIRSFFRYTSFMEPQWSNHIQRVLAIPSKRCQKRQVDFLTVSEIDSILDVIDKSSKLGRRDYALLTLAVHTGLRVSELIHLRRDDVSLGIGAHVRCQGKGRKERRIPIGKGLEKTIGQWLGESGNDLLAPLFANRRGEALSRDGVNHILNKYVAIARQNCPSLAKKRISPHVIRHTTAVNLLQSGVGLPMIALWLGHESSETTQVYLDCDLAYKQKILEKTIDMGGNPETFKPDDQLIAFLQGL